MFQKYRWSLLCSRIVFHISPNLVCHHKGIPSDFVSFRIAFESNEYLFKTFPVRAQILGSLGSNGSVRGPVRGAVGSNILKTKIHSQ